MTEPVTTPAIAPYSAADANALIDSTAKLMLAEREMVRQVREYAAKHNISADNAQALINHLNGTGAAPAWLNEKNGQFAHKDTREMLAISGIKTERDALLSAFNGDMAKADLNAGAAVAAMHTALASGDAVADQTVIAMLNASGQINDQPASTGLGMLASGRNASVANAKFNGIDKGETISRWFGELTSTVSQKADQAWTAVSNAAGPALGAAQDGAGNAAGTAGDWWDNAKEAMSKWSFGGIAGGLGVGALFYLIANALGGNSWFGKIVGVMAGVFGVVMGFKAFGPKDGQEVPDRNVSTAGLQHDERVVRDPHLLRNPDRSAERERNSDIYNVADTNHDHRVSPQEQQAYMQQIAREVAAINRRTELRGGHDTTAIDPFSYSAPQPQGRQPRSGR